VWSLRPPPNFGGWAWVASIDTEIVFSQSSVVKTFRYNPQHPDSLGWDYYLEERRLATGFGLIYYYTEPSWVQILLGCIIAGDTFGNLTSITQIATLPSNYQLKQNYPNPFNPSTTIEFELPEAVYVNLQVYDILGRLVTTIVEGRQVAGLHRTVWDATGMASGIYFIRLTTPNKIQIRNAILMK